MNGGDTSHPYIVTTSMGDRRWVADDADHAREQHEDAFGDDPSEAILEIRRDA
jgi:hypothetical protein